MYTVVRIHTSHIFNIYIRLYVLVYTVTVRFSLAIPIFISSFQDCSSHVPVFFFKSFVSIFCMYFLLLLFFCTVFFSNFFLERVLVFFFCFLFFCVRVFWTVTVIQGDTFFSSVFCFLFLFYCFFLLFRFFFSFFPTVLVLHFFFLLFFNYCFSFFVFPNIFCCCASVFCFCFCFFVSSCLPPFLGQVSEGMDFSDSRARCVVVTGIPYAPAMDPKVSELGGLEKKTKR